MSAGTVVYFDTETGGLKPEHPTIQLAAIAAGGAIVDLGAGECQADAAVVGQARVVVGKPGVYRVVAIAAPAIFAALPRFVIDDSVLPPCDSSVFRSPAAPTA